LVNNLKDYLDKIDNDVDFSIIERIHRNVYLTEEEKYLQIFQEMMKYNIRLVDHIALKNEIANIKSHQYDQIDQVMELTLERKMQIRQQTDELFNTYENDVINSSFVTNDMYNNSIEFVNKLDQLQPEVKDEALANLALEQYLGQNELIVKDDALTLGDLLTQNVDEDFSLHNTEILSNVLSSGNTSFGVHAADSLYVIVSKFSDIDVANSNINVQFLMAKEGDDGNLTIYQSEDIPEYTFELKPSIDLDQEQMLK
jgi:hypothetical protein